MSRPWECPRCCKVNAPWMNQCLCGPLAWPNQQLSAVPATLPPTPLPLRVTDAQRLPDGSFELRMDE